MMTNGEEVLSGASVNFVFKSEKVAAENNHRIFISDSAARILQSDKIVTAGCHNVSGFYGEYAFFSLKNI